MTRMGAAGRGRGVGDRVWCRSRGAWGLVWWWWWGGGRVLSGVFWWFLWWSWVRRCGRVCCWWWMWFDSGGRGRGSRGRRWRRGGGRGGGCGRRRGDGAGGGGRRCWLFSWWAGRTRASSTWSVVLGWFVRGGMVETQGSGECGLWMGERAALVLRVLLLSVVRGLSVGMLVLCRPTLVETVALRDGR